MLARRTVDLVLASVPEIYAFTRPAVFTKPKACSATTVSPQANANPERSQLSPGPTTGLKENDVALVGVRVKSPRSGKVSAVKTQLF